MAHTLTLCKDQRFFNDLLYVPNGNNKAALDYVILSRV